jgi:hypothetical protein
MKSMRPPALLMLAGMTLSGCTTSGLAMVGADAVTQAASGRSITGNIIYAMTGKDCMPFNALTGKSICREEEDTAAAAKEQAPVYCYRTLGQVDCHAEPDPMMSPTTRLYRAEAKAQAKTGATADAKR